MAQFIIPISLNTSQRFEITLQDGDFELRIDYMEVAKVWIMNVTKDDVLLVNGLRLVLGTDLMRPFDFKIGKWEMSNITDGVTDATVDDIGVDVLLLYTPEADLAELTSA